jgi:LCP family protein required for cell wall assembly
VRVVPVADGLVVAAFVGASYHWGEGRVSDDDGAATSPTSGTEQGARPQDALTEHTLRWAPGIGALAVVIGLVFVTGLVLFDRSLDRVAVDGLADDGESERSDGDGDGVVTVVDAENGAPRGLGSTLHVLVAGSDDRSVLSPEERRELSTGDAPGERMEAIALVRIDPDHDRLDVLRFPRDLLVTRCDASRGRINAAYAIGERNGVGGSSCLVQTVGGWTGIPIHHVVTVDFRGFVDAVDAVGGVELGLDEPLRDRRAGLDLEAGCVVLDGADALAFVRARHLDDDFGRIRRQQQLVAATMDQVLTGETLRDPRRLGQLLATAQRSLQMDDRLTAHRLRAIAATVADLGSDDLVTRTIDGEVRRSQEGISFLYPDEEHAEALFDAFVSGELDAAPETARELRSSSAVGDDDTTSDLEDADRDEREDEGDTDDEVNATVSPGADC